MAHIIYRSTVRTLNQGSRKVYMCMSCGARAETLMQTHRVLIQSSGGAVENGDKEEGDVEGIEKWKKRSGRIRMEKGVEVGVEEQGDVLVGEVEGAGRNSSTNTNNKRWATSGLSACVSLARVWSGCWR